jgi:hypothetical protein
MGLKRQVHTPVDSAHAALLKQAFYSITIPQNLSFAQCHATS